MKKLKEEVVQLLLDVDRSYNLTSATHRLNDYSSKYSSRHKKLVPIMLNCCLG